MATTYDGANQRLYVNGNLVASRAQTGAIVVSNSPLRIGGDTVFTGEFYRGLIDDVRVYSRALTASEISLDMSVTENTGPVVTDSSAATATATAATAAAAVDNRPRAVAHLR